MEKCYLSSNNGDTPMEDVELQSVTLDINVISPGL